MNQKEHWLIQIVAKHGDGSYRRADLFSQVFRYVLYCLSLVYRLIINIRNWAYDHRWFKVSKAAAPIISVGNLTTGGTGKTPFVMWLIEQFDRADDCSLAIVSRGYKTPQGSSLNDEGKEIATRFPHVQQVQAADRVVAVQSILQSGSNCKPPVIILDDGFQHRRLHRDLDIVLIDASNPLGYGYLLPRGALREPLSSLRRADIVVLTRSNLVTDVQKDQIREWVLSRNSNVKLAESIMTMDSLRQLDGSTERIDFLHNKKVSAFCGVGNPESFRNSLQEINVDVVHFEAFPDHHHFSAAEIDQFVDEAVTNQSQAIVCTVKDLVKIPDHIDPKIPIFALVADLKITVGKPEIRTLLLAVSKSDS